MKKIYEATNCRVFSMPVEGRRIVFSDGDAYRSARLTTEDRQVQQAVEKSALFGQAVRLVFEEQPSAAVKRQTLDVKREKQPAEAESPAVETVPEAPKAKGRTKSVKG